MQQPISLNARVTELLQRVAAEVIVPRQRALLAADVSEKTPGEVVTVVDIEAERHLSQGLLALLPGSQVIGEEGVAARPELLHQLDDEAAWLIDPIDGTRNFISGNGPFAVMVVLLRHGVAVAAWIHHPLTGSTCSAELGAGAFVDGKRLLTQAAAKISRGIVRTKFLPEELKASVTQHAQALAEVQPGSGCAGADYPAVIAGASDFALYWRTLPWDHAPGVLLLGEAGGHAARLDASAYRASDARLGLLAAGSRELWEQARDMLFAPA